jgi:hypothetical protein
MSEFVHLNFFPPLFLQLKRVPFSHVLAITLSLNDIWALALQG